MKVTCEIRDFSYPAKQSIRVHNCFGQDEKVEIEVAGERYTVCSRELIRAINSCSNLSQWEGSF